MMGRTFCSAEAGVSPSRSACTRAAVTPTALRAWYWRAVLVCHMMIWKAGHCGGSAAAAMADEIVPDKNANSRIVPRPCTVQCTVPSPMSGLIVLPVKVLPINCAGVAVILSTNAVGGPSFVKALCLKSSSGVACDTPSSPIISAAV